MSSGHFVLTVGQCFDVSCEYSSAEFRFQSNKGVYSGKLFLYKSFIMLNERSTTKISTCRIICPIFFNNTVNSQVYVTELFQTFIAQLTEEECEYPFFQQDDTTVHTSRFSMSMSMKISEKNVQFPLVYGLPDRPICLPAIFIYGVM